MSDGTSKSGKPIRLWLPAAKTKILAGGDG